MCWVPLGWKDQHGEKILVRQEAGAEAGPCPSPAGGYSLYCLFAYTPTLGCMC